MDPTKHSSLALSTPGPSKADTSHAGHSARGCDTSLLGTWLHMHDHVCAGKAGPPSHPHAAHTGTSMELVGLLGMALGGVPHSHLESWGEGGHLGPGSFR